ncbi:unnamed protein product [Durusdinium trenchii]|uniref:Uncharacterized protein n=1 Tax=Durusdinium trenchii TaxID=1381693 RepID=A0ABP0K6Q6_9DINO
MHQEGDTKHLSDYGNLFTQRRVRDPTSHTAVFVAADLLSSGEDGEDELRTNWKQLEDLDALAEWAYLATDACIFKALDEDRALTQWWLSPSVHRRNFLGVLAFSKRSPRRSSSSSGQRSEAGHLNPLWPEPQSQFTSENERNPARSRASQREDIFYRVNPEIVQTLTGGALLLLKFTTDMRKALLEPLSPLELYGCVESSWSIVLAATGSTWAVAIGIANITKCEELRKPGVDKLQMTDCFRNGDFVRAQVLALGDHRSYVLTTAVAENLGVIAARSVAGAPLAPISWQFMKCPVTGKKEKRKVAKPMTL